MTHSLHDLTRLYGEPSRPHVHLACGAAFLDFRRRRKRRGEVVFVVQRDDGQVLLHTKRKYPGGVYRLPTGGLEGDEPAREALVREVAEETGFTVADERLLAVVGYTFGCGDAALSFTSYVFLVPGVRGEPQPEDEREGISGFRWIEVAALREVAQQLRQIPSDRFGSDDWGRFRAVTHELAAERLG